MEARISARVDYLERLSRVAVLTAFAVALVSVIAALSLALSWSHRPFPGFLVEQTLVVTDTSGTNWAGPQAGIQHPQQVARIGGYAVTTKADFAAVLSAYQAGQQVSVLTRSPDGSSRLYPSITLADFPRQDLIHLFWMPYLIGLVYLGIGLWIYQAKGRTRPGRALAFFCANIAIVCILLFDLSTTHAGSAVWTAALALTGGALISLAMRFPEEWTAVKRHAWLLGLPYGIAMALAVWGLWVLNSTSQRWAYIDAWSASYRYDACAVLLFLGAMVFRARRGSSSLARRQARVVLFGAVVSFVPITVWFLAPSLGFSLPFNGLVFVPWLLIFPVSVAVAIQRYRLSEADTFVNRTMVYGVLSAIMVGVFAAASGLTQRLFMTFTGEKSDAATVITTLVVAAAFTPIKKRVETSMDARFRQTPDPTRDLKQFGEQVRAFTRMSDAEQITRRLLEEAMCGLRAQSGALSLMIDGRMQTIQTLGQWTGEAWLSVPLDYRDTRLGMLFLGPRQNYEQYSREEFETLRKIVYEVGRAVSLGMAAQTLLAAQGKDAQAPIRLGRDSTLTAALPEMAGQRMHS